DHPRTTRPLDSGVGGQFFGSVQRLWFFPGSGYAHALVPGDFPGAAGPQERLLACGRGPDGGVGFARVILYQIPFFAGRRMLPVSRAPAMEYPWFMSLMFA